MGRFVEKDWADGRQLTKDENSQTIPAIKLLTEVQGLLREGLNIGLLPHKVKQAQRKNV